MPQLPQADEPHHIPSGYWKVIATRDGKLSAFIFDQDTSENANYCEPRFRVSIREIERRTRLKLFPQADASWGAQNLDIDLGCGPSPSPETPSGPVTTEMITLISH